MAEQDDKCPLCGEQMLSLACPGGCFTATAHEVDGLACKLRQLTKAKTKIDRLNKLVAALHDVALALRVGAEATDLGQDCDTAIRWYRQAVLKAGKKD